MPPLSGVLIRPWAGPTRGHCAALRRQIGPCHDTWAEECPAVNPRRCRRVTEGDGGRPRRPVRLHLRLHLHLHDLGLHDSFAAVRGRARVPCRSRFGGGDAGAGPTGPGAAPKAYRGVRGFGGRAAVSVRWPPGRNWFPPECPLVSGIHPDGSSLSGRTSTNAPWIARGRREFRIPPPGGGRRPGERNGPGSRGVASAGTGPVGPWCRYWPAASASSTAGVTAPA